MLAWLAFASVTEAVSRNASEINCLVFSFSCLSSVGGGHILNVVFCGLLGVSKERISR